MNRNKSIFSVAATIFAMQMLTPSTAKAEFVFVPAKSQVSNTNITRNEMPEISGNTMHKLVSANAKLKHVLLGIVPHTWKVRYQSVELEDMLIDLRANNMTTTGIFQDLATRYGLEIRYGDTSGVVNVNWQINQECVTHEDLQVKEQVIC